MEFSLVYHFFFSSFLSSIFYFMFVKYINRCSFEIVIVECLCVKVKLIEIIGL